MIRNEVKDAYLEWLLEIVCEGKYARRVHYRKLFKRLQETEFTYSIPMDADRAEDGIELRDRFGDLHSDDYEMIKDCLGDGPCSLLEMMVALSVRCEAHIMGDPDIGDRTGVWFWAMITNLGLEQMNDFHFNNDIFEVIVSRLLNREYERNGEGGLFTVRRRSDDLRNVDIWYQMCWYLNEFL